jgi:pimeloyl-ACP methyl ester carboxylesterase
MLRPIAGFFLSMFTVLCAISCARAGTLRNDVTFKDYTNLSSNLEMARRMLSPLKAAQLPQLLSHAGKALSEQPIDLSNEKFTVYVPSTAPSKGYGLLVFVPPWNAAKMPEGWEGALDEYGFIFVSAGRSGNDASALGRREPLAVLAEQNVTTHYTVDPERIYVAGFSGGSRIAMHLALAYPDIFRGAILNSGSDPIGNSIIPLPPRDLFYRFQDASRLIYVTGGNDVFVLNADRVSIQSMRDWCMFNIIEQSVPFAFHEAISSSALARALAALSGPAKTQPDAVVACRRNIEDTLSAKLREASSLAASGRRGAARALLNEIDARYGGLAAPRIIDINSALGPD